MKVMSVVGARPQFVKLAPIAHQAEITPDIEHIIVNTGQHYDPALSSAFFLDLAIPTPNEHLNVGSATHGVQTGAILAAMDPLLGKHKPDWVLVYGDTNSTLAAALAAVKLHVSVAHLEAGLRSFNRSMPEEHNRVLVDHAADLLLAPTQVAVDHLAREGLSGRTVLVGDVMTDICLRIEDQVRHGGLPAGQAIAPAGPYVVATIHRAENTDDPLRLAAILAALREITVPVLLLVHPRLQARAMSFGLTLDGGHLIASPPLSYTEMVRIALGSAGVVTDSGGLQKEAFLLGVPCTTLRYETEWPETLVNNWNVLSADLRDVAALAMRRAPLAPRGHPYGDGNAAERVLNALGAIVE